MAICVLFRFAAVTQALIDDDCKTAAWRTNGAAVTFMSRCSGSESPADVRNPLRPGEFSRLRSRQGVAGCAPLVQVRLLRSRGWRHSAGVTPNSFLNATANSFTS